MIATCANIKTLSIAEMARKARIQQNHLGQTPHSDRQKALEAAAQFIRNRRHDIEIAAQADAAQAKANGRDEAFIDRLTLTTERIEAMADGLEQMAALPDPLGVELARWQQPNGLDITRISTALGVIGMIYEARPNVTIDAAGLCIKSGNACLLRCGSETLRTSSLLTEIMREGLKAAGIGADSVQLVPTSDRAAVGEMLAAAGLIDVIIPRGGKALVERVQTEARVPIFAHLEGICHIYVDADADAQKAATICVNAKMRRVGICGAAETILIHRDILANIGKDIVCQLLDSGCVVRGTDEITALDSRVETAHDSDWGREFLAPIIAIRTVASLDEAISHITNFGSGHTESILTENSKTAEDFFAAIDSAIVMANASTQFADGGEFGMGAEIGIATGKLHARGPVGAAQLTSFKYIVRGHGQTRP